MNLSKENIAEFYKIIEQSKNVLIINSKPDGDSLASSISLNYLIARLGKKTTSFSGFTVPDYLLFLKDSVLNVREQQKVKKYISENDLIIIVDANDISRLIPKDVDLTNKKVIVIDHHKTQNLKNVDYALIDSDAESTCGVVVDLFRSSKKYQELIDARVAYFLYLGIVSDTDFFSYSNTNRNTFLRAAFLRKYHIDTDSMILQLKETLSLRSFEFIQKYIDEAIVNKEKKYAYLIIKKEYKNDYFKLPIVNEATNYINRALLRIIDGIDFCFIIKEIDSNNCSFAMRIRNNGNNLDLSKIAEKFNGGGHRQSAGGIVNESLNTFIPKFIKHLDSIL